MGPASSAGGTALLPILILATILTGLFWREPRETFYQRYLDGVRAMTIALESEIEAPVRVMQAFALTPDIDHEDLVSFAIRARRVLVEDNADGRAMLRQLHRMDGHEVHEAVDGLTGVTLAASVQPDVAIVDIGLPASMDTRWPDACAPPPTASA